MNRIRKRLAGAAVLASAAVALSGCVTIDATDDGESTVSEQTTSAAEPPPGAGQPESDTTASESAPPESDSTAQEGDTTASTVTAAEDDHGEPTWCGSGLLTGTSFQITRNQAAGSVSGILTLTNEGDEYCTIAPEYSQPMVASMDRAIPEGDGAYYKQTLQPAPARVELAPGESATAEMRWWETGTCDAVIQGAGIQTVPEDDVIMVGATGPGGQPETSSLCGDMTVHYSGFRHS